MQLSKIKNRKAALELSIGTVVIIVLAMSMLILGIVLINKIFGTATGAINGIDQGVKKQINQLFSENDDRKVILYPDAGIIQLKQGSRDQGFAIAIRNNDPGSSKQYSYKVIADGTAPSCGGHPLSGSGGFAQIIAGESGSTGNLNPMEVMANPIFVRISIAENAKVCTFRVKVLVDEGPTAGSGNYAFDYMDIEVVPK